MWQGWGAEANGTVPAERRGCRVPAPGLRRIALSIQALKPDPRGEIHDSKTGLYRLTAGIDRAIGADPTQSVHASVRARWEADPGYRPDSLKSIFAS